MRSLTNAAEGGGGGGGYRSRVNTVDGNGGIALESKP